MAVSIKGSIPTERLQQSREVVQERAHNELVRLSNLKTPDAIRADLTERLPSRIWRPSQGEDVESVRRRGGLAVPYISSGERKDPSTSTFVWLPGAFEIPEVTRPFVDVLSTGLGIQVITVDYASFGSLDTFVQHFPQFLKDQGASDKVILFGGSLGGLLAQQYTRMNPDKVAGLIVSQTSDPAQGVQIAQFGDLLLDLAYRVGKMLPSNLPNEIVKMMVNKNGFHRIAPKDTMSQIDRTFYEFWKDETRLRWGNLNKRTWLEGFGRIVVDIVKANKSMRRGGRSGQQWDGDVMWIHANGDDVIPAYPEEKVKKVYPNAHVQTLRAEFGHHTPYFAIEEMTEVLVNFLSHFTQPLFSHT